jgi:tetratricopeptide (TPR) repeat protein
MSGATSPQIPQLQQLLDEAIARHRRGELPSAEMLYRQILAADARHPDALFGLGLIASQVGRRDDAIAIWQHAAKLHPRRADAWLQLSVALMQKGDPYQSVSCARRAIEVQPELAEAHSQLGVALSELRKHAEAIEAARGAVAMRPDAAEFHNNLGHVLHRAGRLDEAEAEIRRAIAIAPDVAMYHVSLAALLDQLDHVDESIASAEEALRLGGASPDLLSNISAMERRRRGYRRAVDYADRALAMQPNHAPAHGSRALALLALGDYANGFVEYEWRWRCENFTTAARDFARPMWDGVADPRGRTIFIHTEQGFGDTIQFARYIPMLAARGANVIVECHASLRALLQSVRGAARVVPAGLNPPDFDLHAPLMSLPRAFGTRIDTIPAGVPYLSADATKLNAWRARISAPGSKIGLVWWGNPKPDPARSVPLPVLAPLALVPGVTFYSLQKGDVPADAAAVPAGMNFIDVSHEIKDFADTAAAMMCLDLIITIDTAAAHLAGALARPVWTMLPWSPDWRWMLDRADSPWYPTMRLFRQRDRGDWHSVASQVADELSVWVANVQN